MVTEARIKEIFESIQGEGPVIGYKQLFIRFCDCNLNCKYCDTDFEIKNSVTYNPEKLAIKIISEFNLNKIHSISLTGGEPLLHTDFINKFIDIIRPKYNNLKIYLETNATLSEELIKVKNKTDIISADIKLPSATGKDTFELHDKFLAQCNGVYTFAKIVFDENITPEEIRKCTNLGKKYSIELILQPKMIGDKISVSKNFIEATFDKFLAEYAKVRLIPQVHKFLNVR